MKGADGNKPNVINCSLFEQGTDIEGIWKQSTEETKY
jgi:hypothetical protein